MECRRCSKTFTEKSNLDRHVFNQHIINQLGLQHVDKKYIKRDTECVLHNGKIKDGKIFHCFACNFSVCTDCMNVPLLNILL